MKTLIDLGYELINETSRYITYQKKVNKYVDKILRIDKIDQVFRAKDISMYQDVEVDLTKEEQQAIKNIGREQ